MRQNCVRLAPPADQRRSEHKEWQVRQPYFRSDERGRGIGNPRIGHLDDNQNNESEQERCRGAPNSRNFLAAQRNRAGKAQVSWSHEQPVLECHGIESGGAIPRPQGERHHSRNRQEQQKAVHSALPSNHHEHQQREHQKPAKCRERFIARRPGARKRQPLRRSETPDRSAEEKDARPLRVLDQASVATAPRISLLSSDIKPRALDFPAVQSGSRWVPAPRRTGPQPGEAGENQFRSPSPQVTKNFACVRNDQSSDHEKESQE